MFWSEIGSGFGEPGGTPPPMILSSACCNAWDKTAAGRARAEPSLPAFNETLCEMTTVHNYILFRLKQFLIRHRTGE